MAISLAQTKASAVASATSRTAVWTSNTTSGNLIVVLVFTEFAAFSVVSSITDSQTNAYTKIDSAATGAGNSDIELWYAKNITGGTTPTVTVNFSGTQTCGFIAREYSGIASLPLDQHVFVANSATTASSGATPATTQASELVVGWIVTSSTAAPTVGAGYGNLTTLTGSGNGIALEDLIVSSTGAQTATFGVGVAVNSNVGVATFKASAGVAFIAAPNKLPNQAVRNAGNF